MAKVRPAEPDGPIIPRDYEVGLQPGTDRLRACPSNAKCLSGTRGEKKFTPPFVFFDQKGDAVGQLTRVALLRGGRDCADSQRELLQRRRAFMY